MDSTPYCTVREAAKRSGLSTYYWRQLVREGRVPYVMAGAKYMVHFPAAMQALEANAAGKPADAR